MSSTSNVSRSISFLNRLGNDGQIRGSRLQDSQIERSDPLSLDGGDVQTPLHHEWLGRTLDVGIAALIFLLVLPVFVLLCLAIWVHDGGSPIFVHRRIGRGGRLFPCLKLRTMVVDSEQRLQELLQSDPVAAFEWHVSQKLRNDPRITPLGAFLRKSSLDELPQLLNVIAGHMSLVGPRPIVAAEVKRYGRYFKFYCAVRPGITGLWQVSGRNDVSYRRRVAIDTVYARSRSMVMDLAILTRTVPAVLSSRGCS